MPQLYNWDGNVMTHPPNPRNFEWQPFPASSFIE